MQSALARAAFLCALLIVCAVLFGCGQGPDGADARGTQEPGPEARPVFYVCPMNDVPPLPAPGDCPVCGMQLVRLEDDAGTRTSPARISLPPEALKAAAIQVAPVERKFISAEVRLFGSIEYDPGYFSRVDAFTNGVIDKVYVRRTGDFIRPNQKLFDFYSAEIYQQELELIEIASQIPAYIAGQLGERVSGKLGRAIEGSHHPALQGWPGRMGRTRQKSVPRDSGRPAEHADGGAVMVPEAALAAGPSSMVGSADPASALDLQRRFATIRFRLRSYGLYDEDINEILRLERPVGIIPVRIPTLTSTVGGVLVENYAFQGRYVNAGTPLMTIADPHFVWARLRAFESDYMWLRTGQEVEFATEARPGEFFQGKIVQISPVFDPQTRTFEVGVVYFDKRNKLRPSMLVRAVVKAKLDEEGRPVREDTPPEKAPLVIPASAPLVTGKRAVVYVASRQEPGIYEGRLVTLGPRTAEHYVVKSGLAEGELVVVHGAFKLDSELQLRGRPSMLNPEGMPAGPAGLEHDADPLRGIIEEGGAPKQAGSMPGHGREALWKSAAEQGDDPEDMQGESDPADADAQAGGDEPRHPADGMDVNHEDVRHGHGVLHDGFQPGNGGRFDDDHPGQDGGHGPDAWPGQPDTLPPASPIGLDGAPVLEDAVIKPDVDQTQALPVTQGSGEQAPIPAEPVTIPASIGIAPGGAAPGAAPVGTAPAVPAPAETAQGATPPVAPALVPPAPIGTGATPAPNNAGEEPDQGLDDGEQDAAPEGDPSTWRFPTFPKLDRS